MSEDNTDLPEDAELSEEDAEVEGFLFSVRQQLVNLQPTASPEYQVKIQNILGVITPIRPGMMSWE